MDNVNIPKINIKVGEKEISFSLEAAKELQRILNNTFGNTISVSNCPVTIPYPYHPSYPYPSYPLWDVAWDTGTADGTGGKTLTCTLAADFSYPGGVLC